MTRDSVEAEQLLDRFTSVDEKIDTLSEETRTQTGAIRDVAAGVSALATQLGADVDVGQRSEYPFDMSAEVPTSASRQDPHTVRVEIPYDATITTVHLGFPAGVQQAVGVQLRTAIGERWIPRGGVEQSGTGDDAQYIGFSDETIPVDLNVDIDADNPIVAEFVNNDPDNNHFINVLVLARERGE